jgi:hypothetical protein
MDSIQSDGCGILITFIRSVLWKELPAKRFCVLCIYLLLLDICMLRALWRVFSAYLCVIWLPLYYKKICATCTVEILFCKMSGVRFFWFALCLLCARNVGVLQGSFVNISRNSKHCVGEDVNQETLPVSKQCHWTGRAANIILVFHWMRRELVNEIVGIFVEDAFELGVCSFDLVNW